MLKNASLLYNKSIDIYKEEYVFENKDESWRKKHDYKNLKDFRYQVDEVNKADVTEKEDEDETDQELPPWIKVPNSRFNEIKDVITKANESKLITRLEGRNIALKNAEKARNKYDNIAEDVNKLNKLRPTASRKKILPIFKQLGEIFMGPKADQEGDDETDDETDNEADEQPDTTDMLELESETSDEQRRK